MTRMDVVMYVRLLSRRWLETHIWHAKRMHMREAWGFMLPTRSNRRAYPQDCCTVERFTSRITMKYSGSVCLNVGSFSISKPYSMYLVGPPATAPNSIFVKLTIMDNFSG